MKHKSLFKLFFVSVLGLGAFGVIHASNHQHSVIIESEAADYYADINDSDTGTTLKGKLKTLLSKNINTSYDWSRFKAADEDPNNSSNVITIYSRRSMSKSLTDNGTDNDWWNREHTFPQSSLSGNAKNDNHIVYASEKKVNGARGSIKMGVVTGGTVVNDNNGKPTTCRKTSNLFDPNNLARGIVARTTMYAATLYDLSPTGNFESIATMLRWHLEYQPDTNDLRRNEIVYGNQKNRNPFVDHPEYACRIWGDTNSETKAICGSQPQPATLSISKTSISLASGNTTTISATSSDSSSITWTSSNTSVVTIPSSSSSGSNVTVTAVGAGTATLTAKATIGGQVLEKTCSVTVSEVPPVTPSITLNPTRITMSVGDTTTLTATVKDGSGDVTWKIEGDVASISGTTGTSIEVTGLKEGQTYITATYSGVSVTCQVVVGKAPTPSGGGGGCGGSIIATSSVISLTSLLGLTLLLKRRKQD